MPQSTTYTSIFGCAPAVLKVPEEGELASGSVEQEVYTSLDLEEIPKSQDQGILSRRFEKDWAELRKEEYCGSLNIPPSLFMRAVGGPPATIFVGPSPGKKHELPALLLCHRVKYFENVFMGNFKEAREGILELPDMEVETFDVLIHWVMTGQFSLPGDFTEDIEENHKRDISLLVDVISWADRWLFNTEHDIMLKAMSRLKAGLLIDINRLTPEAIDVAFASGSTYLKKVIAQYCVIPYVRWAKDPKTKFPFAENVNHTPDFMRYISAALVDCLHNREILLNNIPVRGRGTVRLRGADLCGGTTVDFDKD